jgi:hypothetical protein
MWVNKKEFEELKRTVEEYELLVSNFHKQFGNICIDFEEKLHTLRGEFETFVSQSECNHPVQYKELELNTFFDSYELICKKCNKIIQTNIIDDVDKIRLDLAKQKLEYDKAKIKQMEKVKNEN